MNQSRRNGRREQGFTLTEVIVAIAVFVVVFVAALMLYDRANHVFASGSQAADLQQNTRVAFEKLVSDLRMAGFDYDRDGIPFSSAAGVNAWQGTHAYGPGAVVVPTVPNGFTYVADTSGGTSGSIEPSWNTTVGGNTNDGSGATLIQWTTQSAVNQFEQPDEQIEYAGAAAITVRANYDFETRKDCGNGRESGKTATGTQCGDKPNLETPQFPVVTTGNDEIVTYALHSDSTLAGTFNTDHVQFYADVPDRRAFPGGRAENLVDIDGIDLCTNGCNSPPYSLMRITLDSSGAPVRTKLAENIRSIQFQYYNNTTGTGTSMPFTPSLTAINGPFTTANPGSSGGGQYNPLSPQTSQGVREYRSQIQSVRVILIGMTSGVAEAGYQNPAETSTSPARNYRTYNLQSLVVPRNLGKIGQRAVQEAAPGPPTIQNVCVGWCGIARVSWLAPVANPANGTVEQYVIFYDTVSPPVKYQQYLTGGTTTGYVYGLTPGTQYYFAVASLNSFGSAKDVNVLPGGTGSDPKNQLTPDVVSSLIVSGSGVSGEPPAATDEIDSSWVAPLNTVNQTTASCVGNISSLANAPTPPGEIDNYNVWRDTSATYSSSTSVNVANTTTYPKNVLNIGSTTVSFVDKSAVPCKTYYYRVQGLKKTCNPPNSTNNQNPANPYTDYFPATSANGHAGSSLPAAPPATPLQPLPRTPQTFPSGGPYSNCGISCTIYLTWPKVTTDNQTPPHPMTVEDYVITREQWYSNGVAPLSTTDLNYVDPTPQTGAEVTWQDPAALPSADASGNPYQYVYRVKANLASCATPPSWLSGPSPDVRYPCTFAVSSFSANMTATIDGDGLTWATAWESDASGGSVLQVRGNGMQSVDVWLLDYAGNAISDLGTQTSGFNFPIPTGVLTEPGEYYQMFVISKDVNNCIDVKLRYYEEGTPSGCCLAAQANDPFVVQWTPGAQFVDVFLKNECFNDLNLQTNGISIQWNKSALPNSPTPKLTTVDFPATAGGTVSTNVNDNSGNPGSFSVPSGGVTVIPAGTSTYSIRIHFNNTPTSQPVSNVCISYQRAGIDTSNQNCRIVPEPSSQGNNSCN